MIIFEKKERESQSVDKGYKLWSIYGATQKEDSITLGPHTSFQYNNSRRHLLYSMSRYKFAMKMLGSGIGGREISILDLGCSDGFGTYYVAEFAKKVTGVDFDEEAINYAKSALNKTNNIEFILDNFLNKQYGKYDGVVSFDVLEHIYPENEENFMHTVLDNLKDEGTFIVGTPSLETQQYSKENVTGAHVNVKRGEELYETMNMYFHNVYLFTQNDEIIHTGHLRMANYLIAVCCHKK